MRSKDTEIAAVKLLRCLGGKVKVEQKLKLLEGGLKKLGCHRRDIDTTPNGPGLITCRPLSL